jgi:threonine dehydrogenase-like Zn-dependent dehydrogenase
LIDGWGGYEAGTLVTVMPYIHCGRCAACMMGKTNCCRTLSVMGVHSDGGMVDIIAVRKDLVVPVSGLSLDHLALVEPFAIGAHAIRRANPGPDARILVIGAGPIGLGIIHILTAQGVNPQVLERSGTRIGYLKRILPLVSVFNGEDPSGLGGLIDITDGSGFDVIFDATGNLASMEGALQYLSHGGTLVFVGLQKAPFRFDHPEFHRREATIMSSRNAVRRDFDEVIRCFVEGKINPVAIVNRRSTPERLASDFREWTSPESDALKAIIEF